MIRINDIRRFLSIQIDIVSILKLPEKNRMKDKEKEFFIECVIMNMMGRDINDKDNIILIAEKLKFKKMGSVYTYRTYLKNKGWFYKDHFSRFKIRKSFDFTISRFMREIPFNFTIKLTDSSFLEKYKESNIKREYAIDYKVKKSV